MRRVKKEFPINYSEINELITNEKVPNFGLAWPWPRMAWNFCKVPTFKNTHFCPRYLPCNNFVIFKNFTRYLTYKILYSFFLFKVGTLQNFRPFSGRGQNSPFFGTHPSSSWSK